MQIKDKKLFHHIVYTLFKINLKVTYLLSNLIRKFPQETKRITYYYYTRRAIDTGIEIPHFYIYSLLIFHLLKNLQTSIDQNRPKRICALYFSPTH